MGFQNTNNYTYKNTVKNQTNKLTQSDLFNFMLNFQINRCFIIDIF